MDEKEKTQLKHSLKLAFFTAAVILGILIINLVAIGVVDKNNLKIDMTGTKIYELSDVTEKLLAELDKPVTIYVFNSENNFIGELRQVITRFNHQSDRIKVEFIDISQNPGIINEYKKNSITVSPNDIIVQSGVKQKHFSALDMYVFDAGRNNVEYFIAERQLASAVNYVTSEYTPSVAFTDGHNEQPSQALVELFSSSNYAVEKIKLTMRPPGDEVDILVIADPDRDFTEDEIEKLNRFMNDGKSVMVFLGPNTGRLTNLEGFLEAWGIGMMDEVVIEDRYFVFSSPLYIVGQYVPHEITRYFDANRYFTVMPVCRGVNPLFIFNDGISVRSVIQTSSGAYGKKETVIQSLNKESGDTDGPFTLAATASRDITTNNGPKQTRLFVAGTGAMYADEVLNNSAFGNRDFLIQVINWCSVDGTALSVPAKSFLSKPLSIMTYQAVIIGVILTLVIPGLILALGCVLMLSRSGQKRRSYSRDG